MTVFDEPPGGGAPSDRSASGLLEWESVSDAMEALALINHYQMKNASKSWTHISRHGTMQLSDFMVIVCISFQLVRTLTHSNCASPPFNITTEHGLVSKRMSIVLPFLRSRVN